MSNDYDQRFEPGLPPLQATCDYCGRHISPDEMEEGDSIYIEIHDEYVQSNIGCGTCEVGMVSDQHQSGEFLSRLADVPVPTGTCDMCGTVTTAFSFSITSIGLEAGYYCDHYHRSCPVIDRTEFLAALAREIPPVLEPRPDLSHLQLGDGPSEWDY